MKYGASRVDAEDEVSDCFTEGDTELSCKGSHVSSLPWIHHEVREYERVVTLRCAYRRVFGIQLWTHIWGEYAEARGWDLVSMRERVSQITIHRQG